MTRLSSMLLSTLLFGCGTGLIQDEEGKNDWVEVSLSAALIPAVVITASNTYLNNTPSLVADGNVTPPKLDTPARGIRYLKVTTTKSPSWVGWSEIQVNGSRSPSTAPIDPACPGLLAA